MALKHLRRVYANVGASDFKGGGNRTLRLITLAAFFLKCASSADVKK